MDDGRWTMDDAYGLIVYRPSSIVINVDMRAA
jgi:hypothetical protein